MGTYRVRRLVIGITAVAGWNWAINRVIPDRFYIPANLGATAVAVLVAHSAGHGATSVGLARGSLRRGIGVGLVGAAAAGGAMAAASRLPLTRDLFADDRAKPDELAYQTLVRVPLGTVVLEETLFRGVIPAITGGSASSAALFGAWHILPTISTLDINGVTNPQTRLRTVLAGVAATTVAAGPLWWLRRTSGSLVAPMLTHWAVNAIGYVLAARRNAAAG